MAMECGVDTRLKDENDNPCCHSYLNTFGLQHIECLAYIAEYELHRQCLVIETLKKRWLDSQGRASDYIKLGEARVYEKTDRKQLEALIGVLDAFEHSHDIKIKTYEEYIRLPLEDVTDIYYAHKEG